VTAWDDSGDLGTVLDKLRNDVEDLASAVQFLPDRLGVIDGHIEQLRRTLRTVEGRSAAADDAMRELGAVVKRLDARVEWLERNIRLNDAGAVVVELDEVPPDLVHFAEIAEAGHVARSHLMSAAVRSGLESAVEAHADAVRGQAQQLAVALAASRTLADTDPGDEPHVEAIGEFRRSVAGMAAAGDQARALAREAVEASERLHTDDELRAAHAEVIAQGDRAWARLVQGLRSIVADAVGEGALLPAWFTTVLGPIPPAEDTRAWMDAATQLLAYRVTYGVTDPIVPLGFEPGEQHTGRRRAWHQQLKRQLRELQR
jgi:hypothetical protein